MNSFVDLYTDADYRVINRDYYASTWEMISATSDAMMPFQWIGSSDANYTISVIDTDGNETDKTTYFWEDSTTLNWTLTGTGSWTIIGPVYGCSSTVSGDYITTDPITLTANKTLRMTVDTSEYSGLQYWRLRVYKGAVVVYNKDDWDGWDGIAYYTPEETGSDYTIVIDVDNGGETVTNYTGVSTKEAVIEGSGNYWWYDGSSVTSIGLTDIFRLKIVHASYTYYSEWMCVQSLSGKTKLKISSSFDYGGIKYADGYEQYTYKSATVRRSPRADVEITGDKLNGEIVREKTTTAVRYILKMKVTEAEFEALVHGINGTIEITDPDGKTYDAVNVELTDPTWYRTNGIVELSFNDGNNINIWSRNNSEL